MKKIGECNVREIETSRDFYSHTELMKLRHAVRRNVKRLKEEQPELTDQEIRCYIRNYRVDGFTKDEVQEVYDLEFGSKYKHESIFSKKNMVIRSAIAKRIRNEMTKALNKTIMEQSQKYGLHPNIIRYELDYKIRTLKKAIDQGY